MDPNKNDEDEMNKTNEEVELSQTLETTITDDGNDPLLLFRLSH